MNLQSRHPKILFVIDNLSTGGAQRQMVNLATGLNARGYAIEFFCYASGNMLAKPLYEKDIPIHWFVKRNRFSLDAVAALRKIINNSQYHLVLSFLTTPNFYALISGKLLCVPRLPVVVSERFCDLPGGISLLERFSRRFYDLADHIIVNSHHQRFNFERKYPNLKGRISTIYNGFDLKVFAPQELGPANDPLKIVSIASISRYKNGNCLVEALNILRQRYNFRPTVTWIGQKVRRGDRLTYLGEMEMKLDAYHLETQWQWLEQRFDIVQQLHRHDVLVHPSYGEGLPNVVCEALACARPVILSDTLDHPRLVQDGESGYLFDWKNPNDLAQKIKDFSDLSMEKRQEMGKKGREYAVRFLSIDRFVDEYERLFAKILNR